MKKEKKILVHGSIAIDYIMDFDGNLYHNAFIDDKTESFQIAVMPSTKRMQYGGTGGNIAYNLGLIGVKCDLYTSVGRDFDTTEYRAHLARFPNIGLKLIEYPDEFCANCYIVNDNKKQQLIIYHSGATANLPEKTLAERGVNPNLYSWAINSPENPPQMVKVTEELYHMGIKQIMDTGQATPAFSPGDLINMIKKSDIIIANENEFGLIKQKINMDTEEILELIDTIIVTRGAMGSIIITPEGKKEIGAVKPKNITDPTGAGDGYRAGLLTALHRGFDPIVGCKLGAVVSSFVVETSGAQTHEFTVDGLKERYERTFGTVPDGLFP